MYVARSLSLSRSLLPFSSFLSSPYLHPAIAYFNVPLCSFFPMNRHSFVLSIGCSRSVVPARYQAWSKKRKNRKKDMQSRAKLVQQPKRKKKEPWKKIRMRKRIGTKKKRSFNYPISPILPCSTQLFSIYSLWSYFFSCSVPVVLFVPDGMK